jgi:alpha-glucosidase
VPRSASNWWRDGVLYEIYPRSYADANGDGVGDLRGIIECLDHLEWLGVSGVWLNPVTPSPNADWGYDVSDYCDVHPDFGTLAELDELVAEARRRGIAVVLDLVPNHTSDQHAWFRERRDFYVWADGRADGAPPNNWLSTFGGPAWTFDEASGQWYLHNFLPAQPDLDWWNEEVREAFDDILRFWFDRGVAGFRIDVCHGIIKDRELRDDPAVTPDDHPLIQHRRLRQAFSMNRPEVHDVLKRWRRLAVSYDPERILLGETYVLDLDHLIPYYGNGEDQLHGAFNFLFVHAPLRAEPLREIVEHMEANLPQAAWPIWIASTHDAGRLVTRWCDGDPARVRCALMLLLTLRGTPFLYYGDEIGMANGPAPAEPLDPVSVIADDPERNRDPFRTPMQWSSEPGAGFTAPEATPWLPLGDARAANVADQRRDPGSVLHLVRDLIALRNGSSDLRRGAYETLPTLEDAWAYRRGDGTAVALNLSAREISIDGLDGTVAIATDRGRDGECVDGAVRLRPWEGVVVKTGRSAAT